VDRAALVMAMTMTMARVRRTRRELGKRPRKRREHMMGRGKGMQKERGREMIKGKVLLNKPQEEIISLVLLLGSCRRICIRQSRTRRAN
jgi:hypothetical protein